MTSSRTESTIGCVNWPVFREVPAEDLGELLAIARRRRFDRHEVVFHQDDPADSLHLITRGRFAVRLRAPLGDEVLLDIRGPGDVFGELALVRSEPAPRAATVSALEPAETRCVYRADFDRLRARHPETDRALVAVLAGQLQRTDERLVEAHFVDVDHRVARRLLELCRIYGDGGQSAEIPLTQDEIAALAGTTRPSTNRALKRLEERGAVVLQRGRISVLDLELVVREAR